MQVHRINFNKWQATVDPKPVKYQLIGIFHLLAIGMFTATCQQIQRARMALEVAI
jgi:hypothetical protein